jgi:hypothetical protein
MNEYSGGKVYPVNTIPDSFPYKLTVDDSSSWNYICTQPTYNTSETPNAQTLGYDYALIFTNIDKSKSEE